MLTVWHSGHKTHPPKRLDEKSGYGYSTTSAEPLPISLYAHFVHSFTAAASEDPYWVPRNYREAFTCSEASQYREAMDREMDSHTKNQTWELEEPPPDAHILPGTWVYTKKRPPNQPVIYKARWCVCGNRQQEGLDYDTVYSPVVANSSLNAIWALVALLKLVCH